MEIYRNSNEVHWAMEHIMGTTVKAECEACCLGYRAYDKKDHVTPEFGTVIFHEGALHPSVLAHEFTHAAMAFCRRRRVNPLSHTSRWWDGEERAATMVGHMVAEFYRQQPETTFTFKGRKGIPRIKGAPQK